jgi:hypothetical protein
MYILHSALTPIVFYYGFALQTLERNDTSTENPIAVGAKISWRFETPDEITRRPILKRIDVTLDVGVYFTSERPQTSLCGEKGVHEIFIVASNKITRRLDGHMLRPHQHGHEVVALQTAVEFHVVGIQVLGLKKTQYVQFLALSHLQNTLTFDRQTMSTALKYIF